jgi:hypothetical protein
VLHGVLATATSREVHSSSDGVRHSEEGVRGASQMVEKDWMIPTTLLTEWVDL